MADHSSISDEELLRSGAQDDSERITELISRYTATVFSLARKYSAGADYEELVSDGLDALLGAVSAFEPSRGSFAAFASACISNRMKNTLDRTSRRRAKLAEGEELESVQDSAPTPEERVIGRESAAEMNLLIRTLLTDMERQCLEGVVMGYSYAEIAERTGLEKKSVDNAVARARAKLKPVFRDF